MTVAGPIDSVSIAGRVFAVAADADSQRKLGGFENETAANGNGTARNVQTRVPWMVDGLALSIDDDNGDQEFLQAISDAKINVPIAVTYANGSTWQGSGIINGELQVSSANTTGAVVLRGPGKLTKQ
jgi:hypothetical protein